MTDSQPWTPPSWARLIAYLVGIAIFVYAALQKPPHFPLIAVTSVVLIGLTSEVFRQMKELLTGVVEAVRGKSPPPSPPSEQTPD